jgi:hypothetical protein
VECAHGVANFEVDFQHGKEPLAQGKKTCLFDAIDEGDGRLCGKGKLKTLLWAWKGHLMKVKTEVDRPCRKFWKVWRFWAAFQSLGRPVSPSLLGGIKGGRLGLLSASPGPSASMMGMGAGPVSPHRVSSHPNPSFDPPKKSLEVVLATEIASSVVQRDGMSLAFARIDNRHFRPPLARSNVILLPPFVQHARRRWFCFRRTRLKLSVWLDLVQPAQVVGFGPACPGEVDGCFLILPSSKDLSLVESSPNIAGGCSDFAGCFGIPDTIGTQTLEVLQPKVEG